VGYIHLLSKEIWDRHPCCAFAASKEFVTQTPNTYAALLKAIIDATAFATKPENRKQIAEAIAPANYLNQPVTVVEGGKVFERLDFHLRDWLRNEDLFDYGMSPQFLSRFDAVVLLEDLTVDHLVKVFLETPDSAFHQSLAYFESRGIHLAVSPAAVRRIAVEAARQPRLGARALKEVFRRVIRDYEFAPEGATSGGALLLDVAEVEAVLG
jgi:ATP-dependent protease Clp ATPase subunit